MLRLYSYGRHNEDMAASLQISLETVRDTAKQLRRKLGVITMAHAVAEAMVHGC